MSIPVLIACAAALVAIIVLSILFIHPMKSLFFLILHSVIGWAGLYILNRLLFFTSFSIGINIASASIAGILGVPGVLMMTIVKYVYQL